jgi:ABC-type spermidine/putrescine transport system permease subunit I
VPIARARRSWSPEPSLAIGALLYLPLAIVLVGLLVYPILRLFGAAMPDGFNLAAFSDYFSNAARVRALVVTFRDSAAVAVAATFMGFVLAWALVSSSSRLLRGVIWLAVSLPLLMGTVVKNYALLILLQRRGILNSLLVGTGLVAQPLQLLYNEAAVVIGILYTLLPFAVVPIFAALLTVDFDMVRAAESMGASRLAAIRSVVLPIVRPVMIGTGMLIFVVATGFYVVPVVLGGATSPFIATLIQNDMEQFFDMKSAAIAAIVLVILSLVAIIGTLSVIGADQFRKSAGSS